MILDSLDDVSLNLVKRVGRIASARGLQAFLIGGCLRDLVLKQKVLDLDFAIEQDAFGVAQEFAQQFKGRIIHYRQFLTATVILSNGKKIDFSTLRSEKYPQPGALPVVQKGTLNDDLFRRDFSINAMAVCINPNRFAQIVDEFGGMKDIATKKIRVLHDQSFLDDPTRMLRSIRFEQRFGFQLESHTKLLMQKALKNKAFKTVKTQRLFEEFKKNLTEPLAVKNILRLSQLDLLKATGWGFQLTEKQLKSLRRLDCILLELSSHRIINREVDVWLVRLMILFNGMSNKRKNQQMGSWSLTNEDRTKVLSAQDLLLMVRRHSKVLLSYAMFHAIRTRSCEELIFVWVSDSRQAVRTLMLKGLTRWKENVLQISGNDLKRAKIPEGKIYKELLEKTMYSSAIGKCKGKKEQLAYALELYQSKKK